MNGEWCVTFLVFCLFPTECTHILALWFVIIFRRIHRIFTAVSITGVGGGTAISTSMPANTTHLANVWPMLPTVYDVGPTLVKHWLDVSCSLGYDKCHMIVCVADGRGGGGGWRVLMAAPGIGLLKVGRSGYTGCSRCVYLWIVTRIDSHFIIWISLPAALYVLCASCPCSHHPSCFEVKRAS